MSIRRVVSVSRVECTKLGAQTVARAVLALCAMAPFGFVTALRVQNTLPEDTLFGRAVKDTGFATPLVVLGFAALWAFPALASVVGGDLFSAEDRYRTWSTVLTRGCSRDEVFAGKVLTALGFSTLAVVTLAISSICAGVVAFGAEPLVDLSGALETGRHALTHVVLAWLSVLPPVWAFTALAVLFSVATRNSAAGIGAPVVVGLIMQLCAYVDGPLWIRQLIVTTAFEAWHGLLLDHPFYRPLISGTLASAVYASLALGGTFAVLRRRDSGD